jgi:ABC-type transport system substrate-binding protein
MVPRALVVLTLLVAGCSRESAGRGSLVWARSQDSTTLDPAQIQWGEDAKISENLFETLVSFRGTTVELEGRLARSWSFSPDGKSLSFELREGVQFHDGTPFDADSVVFSLGRLIDPAHPQRPKAVPYGPSFEVIAGVEARGAREVVLSLRAPSATLLQNLALFGAAIVSPTAVRSQGAGFAQHPVGTGPYRLSRWDRDERIVLDRFEGYWGPKPSIARVIVVPVASPQTAIQKLRKGEVDVVDHPTLADVQTLSSDPAARVETQPSMNVCGLGFNMDRAPYSDLHFRRAVSLALDRASLNRVAFYGLAEPASNLVPPAIWREISPAPPYEFNLEKAKEELARAKLSSPRVELIHMTASRPYVPEPQRVAEALKDQLRQLGLDVKLTGYDLNAYLEKVQDRSHPMFLTGWSADIPDPDNFFYPLLHSQSIPEINNSFFRDSAFDLLLSQAQTELDVERRRVLYAGAYGRTRELLPILPLVHVKEILGLSRRVDYAMHPIEFRFYAARLRE